MRSSRCAGRCCLIAIADGSSSTAIGFPSRSVGSNCGSSSSLPTPISATRAPEDSLDVLVVVDELTVLVPDPHRRGEVHRELAREDQRDVPLSDGRHEGEPTPPGLLPSPLTGAQPLPRRCRRAYGLGRRPTVKNFTLGQRVARSSATDRARSPSARGPGPGARRRTVPISIVNRSFAGRPSTRSRTRPQRLEWVTADDDAVAVVARGRRPAMPPTGRPAPRATRRSVTDPGSFM